VVKLTDKICVCYILEHTVMVVNVSRVWQTATSTVYLAIAYITSHCKLTHMLEVFISNHSAQRNIKWFHT